MTRFLRDRWVRVFAIVVSWIAPVAAAASDHHVVIVRTYNTYGMSKDAVRTATYTVRRLFSDAGITTIWRDCRIAGRPARADTDACADSLKPNEVIVRVVAGRDPFRDDRTMTLGDSFIDPLTRAGSLATVYADRVEMLAGALQIEFGVMIGRAITHEIAHLLLGTNQHTSHGLMRGTWHVTPLVNAETEWQFTSDEQSAMYAAAALRSTQRPATSAEYVATRIAK